MKQEIIVNKGISETRIAILENGVLAELLMELDNRKSITGNICKGKVTRVLPGMQACFVNIGLTRDAFLYVSDLLENLEDYEAIIDETTEDDLNHPPVLIPAPRKRKAKVKDLAIEKRIKAGQEILVQIGKEPIGTKGARVTSHISLPGRYLVYMPTVDHVGVSRRITDPEERNRLRNIIQELKPPNSGFIARTVGEGMDKAHFKSDIEFLIRMWRSILSRAEKMSAPALVHEDLDLIQKIVRDIFHEKVSRLVIDSEQEYVRCLDFVREMMPRQAKKVKLYTRQKPIFTQYNIEPQIEKALKKRVWLKSGGYLVIEETEALVVVDVNTGRYVGKKNLEDTILKINLEAAKEVAHQIRLRNLGGIIIIDFIDMEQEANRKLLLKTLNEALKTDRARTNVLQITGLGIVEMTRKRVKQSLSKSFLKPCPYCNGSGLVKSPRTVFYNILREINRIAERQNGADILLRVHSDVCAFFYDKENKWLERLERLYKKRITLKSDDSLHHEQYDIMTI